jgi:hypothetical protein
MRPLKIMLKPMSSIREIRAQNSCLKNAAKSGFAEEFVFKHNL